ncbi:MAG: hypothetical protein CMH54_05920 [Myxococcales bacterium]|nr:hypothetical protein [Myxococcales bacterium]|tara:strand:+ start:223 stop:1305 length:1083 start_codon:yes stop_codon:yes gene_type:complete
MGMGPSTAIAQSSARANQALELFQQARVAYEKGDFQGAENLLKRAWALHSHPLIGLKLADVFEKQGKPEESLEALQGIVTDDEQLASKVRIRMHALRSFLEQPIPISVISNVSETRVLVDNVEARQTPFEIKLTRGLHVFEATAEGYRSSRKVVDVRGAGALLVRFQLQPLTGTLAVRAPGSTLQGVNIMLDGLPWELPEHIQIRTRTPPRTVQVGTHQFVCWRPGQSKDIRTFTVREGEDLVLDCQSHDLGAGSSRRTWGYVTASVGAATLLGGGFLLWSYYQDVQKAERENLIMESNKQYFGGGLAAAGLALGGLSYYLFQQAAALTPEKASTRLSLRHFLMNVQPDGNLGASIHFDF